MLGPRTVLRNCQSSTILRQVIEFFACLAIVICLFWTFELRSYLIETGSMAPCLLGYHRRAVCPSCKYPFATEAAQASSKATCPNCGQAGIAVSDLIRNDGDQLFVYRSAYEFKRLSRWEIAVFRNPSRPTQVYVKRMVGLPGEKVQIVQGDVYISGQIQTKSLTTQRSMRIPVYDHDFRPTEQEADWQPRWVPEPGGRPWVPKESGFLFNGTSGPGETATNSAEATVRYRHWIREGGAHATSVRLSRWPASVDVLPADSGPLRYDEVNQTLVCRGCLPRDLLDRLLSQSGEAEFVEAIDRLYAASHIAPITDVYGYNRSPDKSGQNEVRDLMIALQLSIEAGQGQFTLGISDGTEEFACLFDIAERQIRLVAAKSGAVVRTGLLPRGLSPGSALVELSLMDRQVLLAVNGELAFEPWQYAAPAARGPTPWRPVWFAARGLKVHVSSLKLFRDVFYTAGEGRRAFDAPFQLRAGEFFALGDNSPVSFDSRSWPEGRILTDDLFQGKPFLVHLPSRNRRLQIGGWRADIRIPEYSRIRYIR